MTTKDTDTGNVASEDLLASPQYVVDAAYTKSGGAHFPAPLPFHQPLENLRRNFNKFGVPLPLAMERLLRKSEDLDGWRDILLEELGLSRAEYNLLTNDLRPLTLQQVYGFPGKTQTEAGTTEVEAIAELSNAKRFARRLEITYDDLFALIQTRFVNPNADLLPKLERWGSRSPRSPSSKRTIITRRMRSSFSY